MQTAGLGEGAVVDASDAHAQGDGEARLLGLEGHLVEHHGAEVALVLGRATEVEELALRTPSTGGNGRTQCAARRVRLQRVCVCVDIGPCRARDAKVTSASEATAEAGGCLTRVGAVRGTGSRTRACWKIDLVASAEGGDHVAALARKQRSESEARMLMHTVRSSGWCSFVVLNELASWSCCSDGPWAATMAPSMEEAVGTGAIICGLCDAITSAGMVSVCCSWADRSRGSVRTDIWYVCV